MKSMSTHKEFDANRKIVAPGCLPFRRNVRSESFRTVFAIRWANTGYGGTKLL